VNFTNPQFSVPNILTTQHLAPCLNEQHGNAIAFT
jgi:hypothetical protein